MVSTQKKQLNCKKIKNNIIKCNYVYRLQNVGDEEDFFYGESLFFDLNNSHWFRIKTQLNFNSRFIHFVLDDDYEEIKINCPSKNTPLFEKEILETVKGAINFTRTIYKRKNNG